MTGRDCVHLSEHQKLAELQVTILGRPVKSRVVLGRLNARIGWEYQGILCVTMSVSALACGGKFDSVSASSPL